MKIKLGWILAMHLRYIKQASNLGESFNGDTTVICGQIDRPVVNKYVHGPRVGRFISFDFILSFILVC